MKIIVTCEKLDELSEKVESFEVEITTEDILNMARVKHEAENGFSDAYTYAFEISMVKA